MSALETYLKGINESTGLLYQRALVNLRDYMRRTSRPELRLAIRRIKNPTYLRHLWAAGLDAGLQLEVLKRLDEIITGKE